MTFAQRVIDFHLRLRPDWPVPAGIEVLFPYAQAATMQALSAFYRKYYDDKYLQAAVEPYIVDNLRTQLEIGLSPRVALCLGQGKNAAYFEKINTRHRFFEEILVAPHPRWVMQYRRRRMGEFVDLYLEQLRKAWLMGCG